MARPLIRQPGKMIFIMGGSSTLPVEVFCVFFSILRLQVSTCDNVCRGITFKKEVPITCGRGDSCRFYVNFGNRDTRAVSAITAKGLLPGVSIDVNEVLRLLGSGAGSEPVRDRRDRGGIMRGKMLTILEKASLQGYVDEEMKDAMRRLAFEEKPDFFMLEAGLALVEVFKEAMDLCIDDISQGDIEEALWQ